MRWGRWARWPIRWGGGKALAQSLFDALRDGRGTYYAPGNETLSAKELRAMARTIARAQRGQARGAVQGQPSAASDLLPEWERRLGRAPDARETEAQRRGALDAVLGSNRFPSGDAIRFALKRALDDEVVTLVSARPATRSFQAPVALAIEPVLIALAGGGLGAGTHQVRLAGEAADGKVYRATNTTSIVLGSGGARIAVTPPPLTNWPAGVVRILYYLSVKADSADVALVAAAEGGGPVELSAYTSNPGRAGLHHIGVVVTKATWQDAAKRAKIDLVLGAMLPAWTTYHVIIASPFTLATSSSASELTLGGL